MIPNPDATSRQLYERRFEEGYNLFDEGYHAWLKQNHPKYAEEWCKKAVRLESPSASVTTSIPETSVTPPPDATSIQLYERRFEEEYNLFDEGYYVWLKQNHPKYAEEWCKKAVKLQPTCTAVATTASNTASTSVTPQSQDPTKAPNTTPVARTTQQDYVSKYLVQYIAKPVEKTGITNARVLTSDECYKILKEKEELKRKEQQEKEQRKLAREQKNDKEKEKGNKLASRKGKGKAVPPKTSQDVDSNDSDNQEIPDEEDENTDNEDYECPECKGIWEQDIRKKNRAVWVTCTCTKWLHQKCTLQRPEDEDIDDEIFYCSDCVNDM